MTDQSYAQRKNAAAQRRRRLKAYGRYQHPLVTADATRSHIEGLRRYGLSKESIAHLAGWEDAGMVEQIMNPGHHAYRTFVTRQTQARVLAITFDLDALPPTAQLDVVGTQRRLRALSAMGWPHHEITRRLGYTSTGAVSSLLHYSRRYITAANARAVRDLYDELSMTPGPSKRAIGWAVRRGWPVPLCWDDETIDDPAAQPDIGGRGAGLADGKRPADDIADDVAWLLSDVDAMATADQVAHRLGMAKDSLQQALRRAGRPDLLDTLNRNAEIAGHSVRRTTTTKGAAA